MACLVPKAYQAMKQPIVLILVAYLALAVGCGRPTDVSAAQSPDPQKLPFDRSPKTAGIAPTHSLVPAATHVPEGTAITVSLRRSLSSASAHRSDTFTAVLDDPIVINSETVVPPGASLNGQVLDARSGSSLRDPGYLRITLTSLNIGGKQLPISTSSLFAKANSREWHSASGESSAAWDLVFAPGRRLNFRLAENLDLQ